MQAHYVAAANEFPISLKTSLGFSKIQFVPDPTKRLLAVCSWDGFLKIYDTFNPSSPIEIRTIYHKKAVLCCTFATSNYCVSAGLDEVVKLSDIESGRETVMGQHTSGVRCLEFSPTMRTAVSGGWDKLVKLWDIRALMPVGAVECSDKVYALDVVDNRAIVGTKDRQIYVWDIRNMKQPMQQRDSPLKFQIRAIKCFPSGDAFVVSSIEGRVAVEYFDQSPEVQKNKYAFKCHRVKDESGELVYPVNAIAFHPIHRTFATGGRQSLRAKNKTPLTGSDAMVSMWDPFNRKRLCQFRKFPSSITSLAFTADGTVMAIASSYMYEDETVPSTLPEPSLTVRRMTDVEIKPK